MEPNRVVLGLLLCVWACFIRATAQNVTLCWGQGDQGQLATGRSDSRYQSTEPAPMAGDHRFVSVCTGLQHSCALEASGKAWCAGSGAQLGQLGTGSNASSATLAEVSGGHTFRAITCGASFTCALDTGGQAWCFGSNRIGQLGTGTRNNSNVPVQAAAGLTFTSLSAGNSHACGIDTAGRTHCWGMGSEGQLGGGRTVAAMDTPVEVSGGHTFVSVSAGGQHTCGIEALPSGKAYCWGAGALGQLGNSLNSNQVAPVPVSGGHAFSAISSGGTHTCAIKLDSTTYCWGSSPANGLSQGVNVPRQVAGGHAFAALSTGTATTCGLESSGSMWCFGEEYQPATAIVQLPGGHTFLELGEASSATMCAIAVDRAAAGTTVPVVAVPSPAITQASPSPPRIPLPKPSPASPSPSPSPSPPPVSPSPSPSPPSPSPSPSPLFPPSPAPPSPSVAAAAVVPSSPPASTTISPALPSPSVSSPSPSPAVDPSPPPSPSLPTSLNTTNVNATASGSGGSPSSSSSSVPIGAVAGGIAAAVAIAAALAFFALRPGKGWLRRKAVAAPSIEAGGKPGAAYAPGGSKQELDTFLPGSQPGSGGMPGPLACSLPAAAAGYVDVGPDTLLPLSRSAAGHEPAPTQPGAAPLSNITAAGKGSQLQPEPYALPLSYISSSGSASAIRVPPAGQSLSQSDSAYSPASDDMLSFISSYLTTQPHSITRSQPEALASGGASRSSGSGALELRTDARLWEVQWRELTVLRLIGRGSFGAVYLADWNRTRVAVKVLMSKDDITRGELQLPDRVMRELQAEAGVMSRMRHPNVVQFMGLVALPPALITEYCSRGSLYDCLAAARDNSAAAAQLTWHRRLSMAIDGGTGLLYLH